MTPFLCVNKYWGTGTKQQRPPVQAVADKMIRAEICNMQIC